MINKICSLGIGNSNMIVEWLNPWAHSLPSTAAGAPSCPVRGQRLLQQILQHGRGVRGPSLSALNCTLQVLDSSAAFPDFFELSWQNLSTTLPSQACLLKVQLAHLHVILTCTGETAEDYRGSCRTIYCKLYS